MKENHTATISATEYLEYLELKSSKICYEKEMAKEKSSKNIVVTFTQEAAKYRQQHSSVENEYHIENSHDCTEAVKEIVESMYPYLEGVFNKNRQLTDIKKSLSDANKHNLVIERELSKYKKNFTFHEDCKKKICSSWVKKDNTHSNTAILFVGVSLGFFILLLLQAIH